jgi:FKBP-type peptidyl-prolyl cis-trans isomerase FklB
MDVVNKIVQGDTTHSVSIIRAGADAEKFIVNDETFKKLVDKQWKKVNQEKENRKLKDEKYISDNFPGLTTLPDGLRYKVLKAGNGEKPVDGSVLTIQYTGKLISGITFVSSADEGKPMTGSRSSNFSCTIGKDGLIKGLNEVIMDMNTGEKRLVIIPPDLAYGINSGFYGKEISGQKRLVISPGETLILEVTLNKISR